MEKFVYKAKRGLSEIIEGSLNAQTEEDALNELARLGLFPVSIERSSSANPYDTSAQPRTQRLPPFFFRKKKITSKDRLFFTRKLATLIKARVELLRAIKIIYDQTEDQHVKDFIFTIYQSTKEGKPFSQALQSLPEVFSLFYVSMIKAGEASGRIDLSLEQISDYLQRQEQTRTKITQALAYPALLVCVGCASVFVLINFVIPKLRPVLESSGAHFPLITRVILSLSRFSQKTSLFLLPALAVVIAILVWYKGAYFINRISFKLKRKLPIVKDISANQELANFSWVLSLLMKSGLAIYQSFQVASQNIEDNELAMQLARVCEGLRNGDSLAKSMEAHTRLPSFFVKMVGIGEESGRLSEILTEISQSYAQEVESSVALMSSLLEPVLILVLGSVLGIIVFSIMLPIFEVTHIIK